MELTPSDFKRLRLHIHRLCGVYIQDEKRYLVSQRLEGLAGEQGCECFTDFCDLLDAGANREVNEGIISAITTNETSFFRDKHPFETFKNTLLPALGKKIKEAKSRGNSDPRIRIWCAAASAGQEPYSLAMLIHEYAAANSYTGISLDNFRILATDISDKVLRQAVSGEYNAVEMGRGLSQEQRTRYFNPNGKAWKISDELKAMVDFQRLNLTGSFGLLPAFDVIFCRNVLIYFDDATKKQIIERFHRKLQPDGALILGASENICSMNGFCSERIGQTTVYKKK
jgi:chemotaxis protein methyltransferase CheR